MSYVRSSFVIVHSVLVFLSVIVNVCILSSCRGKHFWRGFTFSLHIGGDIIGPYHWNWRFGLFYPVSWGGISAGQNALGGTGEASLKSHRSLFGKLRAPWV